MSPHGAARNDPDAIAIRGAIAARLRSYLDSEGITAMEFARRAGLSSTTIDRFMHPELGQAPSVVSAFKMADVAGFSVDWLIGVSDDREP